MKLIYLAGPITAATNDAWWENIMRARTAAKELWKLGFSVICPHLNTAFMDGYADRECFIQGDLEQIRRCDGVVVLPQWEQSKGTWGEVELARELGKALFFLPHEMERLLEWRDQEKATVRLSDLARAADALKFQTSQFVPPGQAILMNTSDAHRIRRRGEVGLNG